MIWRDYQVLRAVLTTGGYAEAAAVLSLTHPTVRACVERVEAALGAPLFTHAPEGLTPTPAAAALAPILDRVAGTADLFARLATGPVDTVRGEVRIGTGALRGDWLLQPLWAVLMAANPRLILQIKPAYSGGQAAIATGAVDIGLVGGEDPWPDIESRPFGEALMGLFAHRTYLERVGAPASADDLSRFAMIGDLDDGANRLWGQRLGMPHISLPFAFRCNHRATQLAMVEAGLGIGMFPVDLMCRDPDMIRVLPEHVARWPIWLGIRRDMAGVRRIALVRDAMAAMLVSG